MCSQKKEIDIPEVLDMLLQRTVSNSRDDNKKTCIQEPTYLRIQSEQQMRQ